MATVNKAWHLIPDSDDLTRFYGIYDDFISGGIQHSLEAAEQFHQPISEPFRTLPPDFQKTLSKTEWASATLLTDGDLTLSISDDFVNNHSPKEIEQKIQDLLEEINKDVEFFSSGMQRFVNLVKFLIMAPAFILGFKSLSSAMPFLLYGGLSALLDFSVYGPAGAALLLLYFKKLIVSAALRHFFKMRLLENKKSV